MSGAAGFDGGCSDGRSEEVSDTSAGKCMNCFKYRCERDNAQRQADVYKWHCKKANEAAHAAQCDVLSYEEENASMRELLRRLLHDERFDKESFIESSELNRESVAILESILRKSEETE